MIDVHAFAPPPRPDADAGAQVRDKVNRALRYRRRLAAVRGTGLLENPRRIPALDRLVRIAARALRAPTVALTLLTDKLLYPVAVHFDAEHDEAWSRPRQVGLSFAKYVVWGKEPFQVDDALTTDLLRNSHVTRDFDVVAYLGAPLMARGPAGTQLFAVGALSAIDHVPRAWSQRDVDTIAELATMASEEIEVRRGMSDAALAEQDHTSRIMQGVGVGVISTDEDGVITYANPAAETMLGYTAAELVGRDQHALIHHTRPDGSRYRESECPLYVARREAREERVRGDTYWRSDGTPMLVDATMTTIFERGELAGTVLTFVDVSGRELTNRAKSGVITSVSEELDIATTRLTVERARMEAGIATMSSDTMRDALAAIGETEQHLRGVMLSVQHVAQLDGK